MCVLSIINYRIISYEQIIKNNAEFATHYEDNFGVNEYSYFYNH